MTSLPDRYRPDLAIGVIANTKSSNAAPIMVKDIEGTYCKVEDVIKIVEVQDRFLAEYSQIIDTLGLDPEMAYNLPQEVASLHSFKTAYMEWGEKTDWVQDSSQPGELGMHRADVLKNRLKRKDEIIDALRAFQMQIPQDLNNYPSFSGTFTMPNFNAAQFCQEVKFSIGRTIIERHRHGVQATPVCCRGEAAETLSGAMLEMRASHGETSSA